MAEEQFIQFVEEVEYDDDFALQLIQLIERRHIRDRENPLEYYREDEFWRRYRFNKETNLEIVQLIITHARNNRTGLPLLPIIQLFVAQLLVALVIIITYCL